MSSTLADDAVVGLVPIGMNPVTKLWEFYDLRSAGDGNGDPASVAIPTHRPDGNIEVTEATGIVFVLLPGGPTMIGAQSEDPDGDNYDPEALDWTGPPVPTTLQPFFLARHELTMAQWARMCTGDDERQPSGFPVGSPDGLGGTVTGTHPVERVSWNATNRLLRRHGLTFPTEAQWEYACRAGTTTAWWTGQDAADLVGVANFCDRTAAAGAQDRPPHDEFDDGHDLHAPVGSFRSNPFGLFDMHGNVAEWCFDPPAVNVSGFVPGHGERAFAPRPEMRSYRGGSFRVRSMLGRSALTGSGTRDGRGMDVGVRAARRLPS